MCRIVLVPDRELSAIHKKLRPAQWGDTYPVYTFLWGPSNLSDIFWTEYFYTSFWYDNDTMITISCHAQRQYAERRLCFTMYNVGEYTLECAIYGKTDAAIAETATWFWTIKHSGEGDAVLEISASGIDDDLNFDVAALQPEQLAEILYSNPQRLFRLQTGKWTAEQSVILATTSFPLQLILSQSPPRSEKRGRFTFEDEGAAFVNALENRQSSFGSLFLDTDVEDMYFSSDNLKRLLKVDKIERLRFNRLNEERILLPFSARANAVVYDIDSTDLEPEDFNVFDIATKNLTLNINVDDDDLWNEPLILFLYQMAEMGHFEGLSLHILSDWEFELDNVERLVEAVVRIIQGNKALTHLDLSRSVPFLTLTPHLHSIFKAMENHSELRTFIVEENYYSWGYRHYFWLEQLLSRNRNINVLNRWGRRCSNGSVIDKLYALNTFYRGSAMLMKEESTSLRPLLVAAALNESASGKVQRTALLLSHHTDMLCEFVHGVDLDAAASVAGRSMEGIVSNTIHASNRRSARSKRKRK